MGVWVREFLNWEQEMATENAAELRECLAFAPETRITESYARMVARNAYFWAWPLVNLFNKRLAYAHAPAAGLVGGIMPIAPLNHLCMLTDYIEPEERAVACPNQDVIYGTGSLALDLSPVVIQVPDFGNRFWVYQVVDVRTDSFAELGAMYGTPPGFYLLVGPNWQGEAPLGINKVFRSTTNTGYVCPRVFQQDSATDKSKVQALLGGINLYPLALYDGKVKSVDWHRVPVFPQRSGSSGTETTWVLPDKFFDQLPSVLEDAPPLPGEEARYAELLSVIAAAAREPAIKQAMVEEAKSTESDLISPLLEFRNFGIPLPYNWTTQNNGAAFGTDYFTRTAVAKSNILVNKPNETKYFYQDLDADGVRLNGENKYTVTFAREQFPPVKGFWSLTLYDQDHFFAPNEIKRYSVGTKHKDLKLGADGSLTIYVQAETPSEPAQRANWLPAPREAFSLYLRAYWPQPAIASGQWTPPAVNRVTDI
jgi:hypothetical protein